MRKYEDDPFAGTGAENDIAVVDTDGVTSLELFPMDMNPDQGHLADGWVQTSGSLIAYGLGEWRVYDNLGCWVVVDKMEVKQSIQAFLENCRGYGVKCTSDLLSGTFNTAHAKLYRPDSQWNTSRDIVVCNNGTYELGTGKLREHSYEDYAISRVNFDYDSNATCPTFEYAIRSSVPEVESFMQEFYGYCLTTDTHYEISLWFKGEKGSGKSTLTEGLSSMLGDKCDTLGLAEIERSQFALHRLPGKTAVISTEQPADYIKCSYILNAIISGEPVTIESKFKDSYTFRPTAKILWAMNELPRVSSSSDGLFRRVKVVEFPPRPEEQRDPEIKERIKQEGAGILNWAIEGLKRLRERKKFDIPQCVRDATEDFREFNDVPGVFVKDACFTGSDYRTQSSALYKHYQDWCLANGHKSMSSTMIAKEWARLGFDRVEIDGKRWWKGVGIPDSFN